MVENGAVFGGFFVWLKLPDNISADLVVHNAKLEENLLVTSSTMFEVSGDEDSARFTHNVRLSFAWEDEERLDEGVRRFGSVVHRLAEEDKAI
jgi:DNA-binding transcriptional MocR family regulator